MRHVGRRSWDASFTGGLLGCAAVTLLCMGRLVTLAGGPGVLEVTVWGLLFFVVLLLFLAASLVPAVLRLAGRPSAFRATVVGTGILLFWFPPGTGLFLWWVLWIRDRERLHLERPMEKV